MAGRKLSRSTNHKVEVFQECFSPLQRNSNSAYSSRRHDPPQFRKPFVHTHPQAAGKMRPPLGPVRTLPRQLRVCNPRAARHRNPSLFKPRSSAFRHLKRSPRGRCKVAFSLQRVRDRYPQPSGKMRVAGACMLKASKRWHRPFHQRNSARPRRQHQQRLHCVSDLLIRQFVIPVTPSLLRCDESSFGQPRQMLACRLRAYMRRHRQLSCRYSAASHQREQHGRPRRLCKQLRGVRQRIAHVYSMQILFRQHFGPCRNIVNKS
jgi:hypothetical protein